jgi:membrane fusion protein, multidrug efflux system
MRPKSVAVHSVRSVSPINRATLTSLAVLASVCMALCSCGHDSSTTTPVANSASAASLPQVNVTVVQSKRLKTTIGLPAELVPYEAVDLYARETGFVKSIRVDRGSSVKQGELIAEIEAPELVAQRAQANAAYQSSESQLAAAQAKLAADQATFERTRAAAKTPGVVAPNDLEIAEKTAQSDQANVDALRKTADAALEGLRAITQLESYLRLTAPFDGQITTRYVHPGTLIGPATGSMTPIVRIETVTRHRLVVPVPENDVAGVPEGTLVNFTVPSFPAKIFTAPIARISHGVDVKTRTMPVELDVRDPKTELVPGTFCQVQWPVSRTYATLFVPASAVGSDLERTFVIRVRSGKTEWVDVKTGVRVENSIEVFGDLKEGDQVAVRGTDQLRPGTAVSPNLSN